MIYMGIAVIVIMIVTQVMVTEMDWIIMVIMIMAIPIMLGMKACVHEYNISSRRFFGKWGPSQDHIYGASSRLILILM